LEESSPCIKSIILLTEKKYGRIKSTANGKPKIQWMDIDDVAIPTVTIETTILI